jgi:hypothetical protein
MPIQKRPDVIQDVIKALESGNLIPSVHALVKMKIRDIQFSDIEEALYSAKREEEKDSLSKDGTSWKYALRGENDTGDKDLRIIVAFADPKTIIVTAIDKNKRED